MTYSEVQEIGMPERERNADARADQVAIRPGEDRKMRREADRHAGHQRTDAEIARENARDADDRDIVDEHLEMEMRPG